MEVNIEVHKKFDEVDGDAAYLEQVLLVRDDVGLHGGRQAVHPLQVGAKWSRGCHGGKKTVASLFKLDRDRFRGSLVSTCFTEFTDWPPM